MKKIKLSNGVEMPQLGYGVYQVEPDECERCVLDALSVGYRMIDTAQAYLNEEAVGNAWKKSGVNRDEIFLVSKVWPSNYGDGQTMKSIDESLRKLQTDYIDLMLLHQPYCDRYGAYRDLEKAYKAGKGRAIGVSNFFPDHLIDLASNMEIAPMVNQMETHVFNQQHETRKFMKEFGTKLMAWAPLAERPERTVHQPYPHPDWREIRQDCRTSSLALAAAERRDHHPEDRSQGTHGRESESLRLRTRC